MTRLTANDLPAFAILIRKLATAFGVRVSDERISVYFEALANRPLSFTARAVRMAIESEDKFPSVHQLRKCGKRSLAEEPPPKPLLAIDEPVTPAYQEAVKALIRELQERRITLAEYYPRLQALHALSSDPRRHFDPKTGMSWAAETAEQASKWQATMDARTAGVEPYPHIGRSALKDDA